MRRRRYRPVPAALAAAGAVCVLLGIVTACGTVPAGPAVPPPASLSPSPSASPAATAGPRCGVERWPVKVGTDQDAALIDLHTVVPATIARLAALPAPAFLPAASRVKPAEVTVYQVTATLKEFKMEPDSDVHLVLSQVVQTAQGPRTVTMIAEIPSPACAGAGSPLLPGITAARDAFAARYHPGGTWQPAGVQATVTGAGFFDELHGQTGVAPNGIELHPVLDIQWEAP